MANIGIVVWAAGLSLVAVLAPVSAQQLDENCIVSILNRTVNVDANGSWTMPNVPANQGQIRARATCEENGLTVSGQSEYFGVAANSVNEVPTIQFGSVDPIPIELSISTSRTELNSADQTAQLTVTATFSDGSNQDVTGSESGINYLSSNPTIATVSEEGLVTARVSGNAMIIARKDGAVDVENIRVNIAGDSDGDGLPDDFELAAGLNPNDPVDAFEDRDGDGLSNLGEFESGTDLDNGDTDNDGIADGEEVVPGQDGFVTNPLLGDSDGDRVPDLAEVLAGTDPTDPSSVDVAAAMTDMEIQPARGTIIFNSVDNEGTLGLKVLATLLDESVIDITSTDFGTNYSSSDLTVVDFGAEDGVLFAKQAGQADIRVTNGGFESVVPIIVEQFDPIVRGFATLPRNATGVAHIDGFVYVSLGRAGWVVVDVRDDDALEVVSEIDTSGTAQDILIQGNTLYVADAEQGIKIFDVSDPASPTLTGLLDTVNALDLWLQDDLLYVADGSGGLKTVNVAEGAEPLLIGELALNYARSVSVDGDIAVLASSPGLVIVDVGDPSTPVEGSSISVGSVRDLAYRSPFLHVAAYTTGYRIYDLTEPSFPDLTASFTDFFPVDVGLEDRLAFFPDILFASAIPFVDISDERAAAFGGVIDIEAQGFGDLDGRALDLSLDHIYMGARNRLYSVQHRKLVDDGTIAPTTVVMEPGQAERVFRGQNLQLSATAEDDVRVAFVEFSVDGVVVGSDGREPYRVDYVVPDDEREVITLIARAFDTAGNIGESEPLEITLEDNQPAEAAFAQLTAGEVVQQGQPLDLSVDVSDPEGVDNVVFFFDGLPLGVDAEPPYSLDHTLEIGETVREDVPVGVEVMDAFGVRTSHEITIDIVANEPPTITLLEPTGGEAVAATWARVKLLVQDDVGVERVTGVFNDGEYQSGFFEEPDAAFVRSFDLPEVETATDVPLTVLAVDNYGVLTEETLFLSVVPDQPPSVAVTAPDPSERLLEGRPVEVQVAVSDDVEVNDVELYMDGQKVGLQRNLPYEFEVEPRSAQAINGSMSLFARAYDSKGRFRGRNQFADSDTVTYGVDPDNSPEIFLSSPVNGVDLIVRQVAQVVAEATDDFAIDRVFFQVDGSTVVVDTTSPFELEFSSNTPGTFTLTAIARDNIGQETTSLPVEVDVLEDEPPSVSVVSPVDGETVIETDAISIQAQAFDDVAVDRVELLVNGDVIMVDGDAPYEASFDVPPLTEQSQFLVTARAIDNTAQATDSEPVLVLIEPDPLTTVTGRVVDEQGLPVTSARVTLNLAASGEAFSDSSGEFRLEQMATIDGEIQASASARAGDSLLSGSSSFVRPKRGSITDVGEIVLGELKRDLRGVLHRGNTPLYVDTAVDERGRIHTVWTDLGTARDGGEEEEESFYLNYQLNDSKGNLLIGPSRVSPSAHHVVNGFVRIAGNGRTWIVWSTEESGPQLIAIDADLASRDGGPVDPADVTVIDRQSVQATDAGAKVQEALISEGNLHLVWTEMYGGPEERLQYQAFGAVDGLPVRDPIEIGLLGDEPNGGPLAAALASDGEGHLVAFWDYTGGDVSADSQLFAAAIDAMSGAVTDEAKIIDSSYRPFSHIVLEGGSGSVHAVVGSEAGRGSFSYWRFSVNAQSELVESTHLSLETEIDELTDNSFGIDLILDDAGDIYLYYPDVGVAEPTPSGLATKLVLQKFDAADGSALFNEPVNIGFVRFDNDPHARTPFTVVTAEMPGSGEHVVTWTNWNQLNTDSVKLPITVTDIQGTVAIGEPPDGVRFDIENTPEVSIRQGRQTWSTQAGADGAFELIGLPVINDVELLLTAYVLATSRVSQPEIDYSQEELFALHAQQSVVLGEQGMLDVGTLTIEPELDSGFVPDIGDVAIDITLGKNEVSRGLGENGYILNTTIPREARVVFDELSITTNGVRLSEERFIGESGPFIFDHRWLPAFSDDAEIDNIGAVHFNVLMGQLAVITWRDVATYPFRPSLGRRPDGKRGNTYQIVLAISEGQSGIDFHYLDMLDTRRELTSGIRTLVEDTGTGQVSENQATTDLSSFGEQRILFDGSLVEGFSVDEFDLDGRSLMFRNGVEEQ